MIVVKGKNTKLVTIANYVYKMDAFIKEFEQTIMYDGLKIVLFTNYNRVVFEDLGLYYCFYKNMEYRDLCTYKWMLESDIKFEDMTIEDAEVLKFYRECMAAAE